MKKVKEFFDKKSKDIKFSTAGTGHKLSDGPRPGPSNAAPAAPAADAYSNRRAGPDPNVAAAVLARFESKDNTNKPTAKSTLHNIMEDEKKKIIEENRQKEKEQVMPSYSLSKHMTHLIYAFRYYKRNETNNLRKKKGILIKNSKSLCDSFVHKLEWKLTQSLSKNLSVK